MTQENESKLIIPLRILRNAIRATEMFDDDTEVLVEIKESELHLFVNPEAKIQATIDLF